MTITEVMAEIAEKQKVVAIKQAEIAEIGKEIGELEKNGLGLTPGKNLGITDMVGLIQRIMAEAVVTATSDKKIVS